MPMTLFVDDGLLAELLEVPDHDIAARAFAQAVRSRLGGEGSGLRGYASVDRNGSERVAFVL